MKARVMLGWLMALVAAGPGRGAPELKLEGFGVLKNLELRGAVELLLDDGEKREVYDAAFIEDAALVLNSELVEAGYFAAEVEAVWRDTAGAEGRARLDARLTETLPRETRAVKLRLIARPGVRAVLERVELRGLQVLDEDEARSFFIPGAGLFATKGARAWSEAKGRRGVAGLAEAARARGHAEAKAEIVEVNLDKATGRTEITVTLNEGPEWRVADAGVEVDGGEREALDGLEGQTWTNGLALDEAQGLRRKFEAEGHPEVRVKWETEPGELAAGGRERAVRVTARVERGERFRVGGVEFEGVVRTRRSLLEERTRELRAGDAYDPAEVEAARLRLARLGVFRRVETREKDGAAGERAVVFALKEEAPWEAAWMLGWGSYEQARAGVEVTRRNVWGLAHRTRFDAVQSLKGTRADYRYTVPTLFQDTVEATGRVFGLRREEPSFERVEYGAAAEARRAVPWIEAVGTAGFTYEVLSATDVVLGRATDEVEDATVSSLDFGVTRDRRDNPIRPQAGARWSAQMQLARPELGGDVRYERVELAWSWHRAAGEGRWVHVGATQSLVFDHGGQVPVSKLFYPGGESSIRGYGQGEATQRDGAGRLVGVRSAWLVNVELEQLVTGRWSAVLFADVLGTAVETGEWPGDETLGTVGAGVRYQSPIGPVRLEYGRNVEPRPGDPDGTLHFSIGFPF